MVGPYEVIFKLLLGTLLGGIIGFERQTHGRAAGFRTQLLVCVSCVLLMIISESYYAQGTLNPMYARIDPTRIAAGAMTGIGFLGAGVILKTGFSVQGLTTAACIWIVSAIGLAIGAGLYLAAVAGFVITFLSLWVLRILEAKMPRVVYKYIKLVTDATAEEAAISSFFQERGFEIIKMDYEIEFPKQEKTYTFTIATRGGTQMKEMVAQLGQLKFIKSLAVRN
jgi:putative Mg2+ transporter-C (MgtC) family protein